MTALTYDLADANALIGGPSVAWLAEQIRRGRIPARKIGRHWRMTDADIQAALDAFRVTPAGPTVEAQPTTGLTRTSARKLRTA